MNATAETVADALERYAACLRSAEAGAVRLKHRIEQLHRYMIPGVPDPLPARRSALAYFFVAELRDEPTGWAPAQLVDLIVELHSNDADEHGEQIPLKAFETLLDTLRGIAMVERSSLGNPAAVRLCRRTPVQDLRSPVLSCRTDRTSCAPAGSGWSKVHRHPRDEPATRSRI